MVIRGSYNRLTIPKQGICTLVTTIWVIAKSKMLGLKGNQTTKNLEAVVVLLRCSHALVIIVLLFRLAFLRKT